VKFLTNLYLNWGQKQEKRSDNFNETARVRVNVGELPRLKIEKKLGNAKRGGIRRVCKVFSEPPAGGRNFLMLATAKGGCLESERS